MATDPNLEATAGALGTLLSCVTLYPVETAKVHIQAGRSKEGTLATMKAIVRDEQSVLALFKGLPAKSVHVIANNYIYFYIYEWLKAYRAKLGMRSSTLANTCCGVIAGCMNLSVTLPLDTLVVRFQTSKDKEKSVWSHASDLASEGRRGLWRGMGVSSILTLNPAITFAVFDAIKARITEILGTERLSALQAFVVGSAAKAVATVLTYPLIRCKTVMQQGGAAAAAAAAAAATNGSSNGHHAANGNGHHAANGETTKAANGAAPSPPQLGQGGMVQVLLDIVRNEGFEGLYRGCSAQIFTAVCKSGILLTMKEKIAAFALALLITFRRTKRSRIAVAAH